MTAEEIKNLKRTVTAGWYDVYTAYLEGRLSEDDFLKIIRTDKETFDIINRCEVTEDTEEEIGA